MEIIWYILTICTCSFFCYNAGRYNAHAKIYEKAIKEYIRLHFEEEFQDDVNLKMKEKDEASSL